MKECVPKMSCSQINKNQQNKVSKFTKALIIISKYQLNVNKKLRMLSPYFSLSVTANLKAINKIRIKYSYALATLFCQSQHCEQCVIPLFWGQ